jgi:hypothetical protein
MREKSILFYVLLLVFASFTAASAVTIVPGSTNQSWDFLTDANPAIPEVVYNPYGSVEATLMHAGTNGGDPVWSDGVWSGSSSKFTTIIPNTSNTAPDSYKNIVVQVGVKGNICLAQVKIGDIGFSRTDRETSTYEYNNEIWTMVTDTYHIEPNPMEEYLCYALSDFSGGEQYLDFVSIYTVCVPEPMTVCLLGLGCLALIPKGKSS